MAVEVSSLLKASQKISALFAPPTTMSICCGESSTGPPSPGPPPSSPLYLTFNADPATPSYETVPVTLSNGKPSKGRACELCGRVIPIGSKGSLHAFDTHKSSCAYKKCSITRPRHTSTMSHARSLSATPLSGCSFYVYKIRSFSDFVFENFHSFYFSP